MGTIVGIPIYLLMRPLPLAGYLALVIVLALIGVWACGRAAEDLGAEDPRPVVWDEIVGILVTLTAAPAGWPWLVVGFALFRVFDILKPWPIRAVERRLGGGWGIMLDDVVAGVLAAAVLQAAARWLS
jgi:phosphatidylglycerophosphatase A